MNTATVNTNVSARDNKAAIYAAVEALRLALDAEREAHRSTKRDLEELRALRAAAIAKAKAKATPRKETTSFVPSDKAMTINEFCEAYCKEHGTRSVPGAVVKAWRASFKCTCGKCGGTGDYGVGNICYACCGTGEQTVADVARNRAYWKLNAPEQLQGA